jgi:hypothetical protein
MPKEPNIQFANLIYEIFGPTLHAIEFQVREQNKYLVVFHKGDIELIFRLEPSHLFYDNSIEIRLSGKLAKEATPDSHYRHLGLTTIAECLDADYKMRLKKAQTEEELREILLMDKGVLLNYGKSVLAGDVSSWQLIVDCLKKRKIVRP